MSEKIKELLDGKMIDGVTFAFVEKKGIEMTFHASGDDIGNADAVTIAKSAVKSTDYGKGLYFSVVQK